MKSAIIKICETIGYILDNKDLLIEYNNIEYSGKINLINQQIFSDTYQSLNKEIYFSLQFESWCKDIIDFYKDNYKLSVKAHYIKSGEEQIIFKNFSIQDWFIFRNCILNMYDIFNTNYELKDEKDFYFERCGIQYILDVL